jgi:hypothetical protein
MIKYGFLTNWSSSDNMVARPHKMETFCLPCQVSGNKEELYTIEYRYPDVRYWYIMGISVGIRDILVPIRIPGSVPLTDGSGSGSNSGSDYLQS